jgi:multidrug efflux pump subunit AcrA (membrane-fusion protein)
MKKKKSKLVRNIVVFAGVIAVLSFGIWFQMDQNRRTRIENTPIYTIQRGEISLVSLATGKLSSADQTRIRVEGSVTRLDVSLGERVQKNQVLAEYQRQSFEAETQYSPVSGIVTQMPLGPNSKMLITNMSQLSLEFTVSEFDRQRFKLGQKAEVYVQAIDTTFYGQVSKLAELSLTPTSVFTIAVTFNNTNPDTLLGMSGVAKIPLENYGDFFAHGKLVAANPTEILVQGTVVQSFIQIGDRVTRGAALFTYQGGSTRSSLLSTVDGVVTQLPGAMGNEFVISQSDQLQLVINISETDIHKIRLNQTADIFIEAINQTFVGSVSDISNVGNTALDYTTYPVTLSFDGKDFPLFIGMSASARIVVETKPNILVVPFEALISVGTERYVISAEWLQNPNRPRSDYYIPVKTGIADVYTVEVIGDNLENTDIIIIEASAGFPFFRPNQ